MHFLNELWYFDAPDGMDEKPEGRWYDDISELLTTTQFIFWCAASADGLKPFARFLFLWIKMQKRLDTLNRIGWADALVQSKACEFRLRQKGYIKSTHMLINDLVSPSLTEHCSWWNNSKICVGEKEKGNLHWLIPTRFHSMISTFLRKIFNESLIRIESFFRSMLIYPMYVYRSSKWNHHINHTFV